MLHSGWNGAILALLSLCGKKIIHQLNVLGISRLSKMPGPLTLSCLQTSRLYYFTGLTKIVIPPTHTHTLVYVISHLSALYGVPKIMAQKGMEINGNLQAYLSSQDNTVWEFFISFSYNTVSFPIKPVSRIDQHASKVSFCSPAFYCILLSWTT